MDASRASGEALRDSLGILSETMESVAGASKSNVDAVNRIAEHTRESHRTTSELFRRTQKQATVMSAVSWALALAALAVAGYVAVMVTNVADRPIASQASPAATPGSDAAAEATGESAGGSGDATDAATTAQATMLPAAPLIADEPTIIEPPAPTISDDASATTPGPMELEAAGADAGWLGDRLEELQWLPALNLDAVVPGLPAGESVADAEAPAAVPAEAAEAAGAEAAEPAAEAIGDPAPSAAKDEPTTSADGAGEADAVSEERTLAEPSPAAEPTPVEASSAE